VYSEGLNEFKNAINENYEDYEDYEGYESYEK
jgi:hypothetical protein